MLAKAVWLFLRETRTAIWHGLLAALVLLLVFAFLMSIWTRHPPPLAVFITWILIVHSAFCLLLGSTVVVVAAQYEFFLYFFRDGFGFARWFKDATGLTFVGLCGLGVLKIVILCCPQLLP